MFVKLSKRLVLGFAVTLSAATLGASVASAQSRIRSVEERRQGKGFWENSRASRSIQHARDYSHGIQQYTAQSPRIDPVITKAESKMLGHHVQGVQREMAAVREATASNPQVAQQVKAIETKVAQVASTQRMLHEECCKDSPDGKVCADMAAKITATLDQIAKDHAELLRTTGHEEAAVDHGRGKASAQTPAKTAE